MEISACRFFDKVLVTLATSQFWTKEVWIIPQRKTRRRTRVSRVLRTILPAFFRYDD
jgi:hypothetical protein